MTEIYVCNIRTLSYTTAMDARCQNANPVNQTCTGLYKGHVQIHYHTVPTLGAPLLLSELAHH